MRLADFLVDHGGQKYGKPLAYFIERLFAHDNLDEAKQIFDENRELVEKNLSDHIKKELDNHQIELEIEPISDKFGPITASSKSLRYLQMPIDVTIIDKEDQDFLKLIMAVDEPLGIDLEWRPSLNVFHEAQGPSIMQLSNSKNCFIFDLLSLKDS